MQRRLQIQLDSARSESLTHHVLQNCSIMPLHIANAEKITFNEGQLVTQSISHYLAHIEVKEHCLTQEKKDEFLVQEPIFFLYANLNSNSCYLGYRPPGVYQETINSGHHQSLFITFRSDWLIHKCERLKQLTTFTKLFQNKKNLPINLPSFSIARSLFKSLKKIDATTCDLNMDGDLCTFVNSCINKYYKKLSDQHPENCYYLNKTLAITEFIQKNFNSEIVEYMPKLASLFMTSERTLARLAKKAFGSPLHEQVIKLRMEYSLDLLTNTTKPIHEIALLAGYREAHYFSKAFKKHFGCSPKHVERCEKRKVA